MIRWRLLMLSKPFIINRGVTTGDETPVSDHALKLVRAWLKVKALNFSRVQKQSSLAWGRQ